MPAPVVTHVDATLNTCPVVYTVQGLFSGFGSGDIWKQYGSCGGCLAYIISDFSTVTGVIEITNGSGTQITTGDLKP